MEIITLARSTFGWGARTMRKILFVVAMCLAANGATAMTPDQLGSIADIRICPRDLTLYNLITTTEKAAKLVAIKAAMARKPVRLHERGRPGEQKHHKIQLVCWELCPKQIVLPETPVGIRGRGILRRCRSSPLPCSLAFRSRRIEMPHHLLNSFLAAEFRGRHRQTWRGRCPSRAPGRGFRLEIGMPTAISSPAP
jgi:hypothetical protein